MEPSMTAATSFVPSADEAMLCQNSLGEVVGVQLWAQAGLTPANIKFNAVQVSNRSFIFMFNFWPKPMSSCYDERLARGIGINGQADGGFLSSHQIRCGDEAVIIADGVKARH